MATTSGSTGASGGTVTRQPPVRWVRGREGNTLQYADGEKWVDVPTVEPGADEPASDGASGASGATGAA